MMKFSKKLVMLLTASVLAVTSAAQTFAEPFDEIVVASDGTIETIDFDANQEHLSRSEIELKPGGTSQLYLVGAKKKVKWSSSDKKVAKVNKKGRVTAKADGVAKIIAKDGKKEYACIVSVVSPETLFDGPDNRGVQYYEVPEGTTTINGNAFANCSKLETVSIPESVTKIGFGAFQGCYNLKEIRLPSRLKYIGALAFEYSGLTSIDIPESVMCIDSSAFSPCTSLTQANIPANAMFMEGENKTLKSGIFNGCSSLTNVTLPNGLQVIPVSMFVGCTSLEKIQLPGSVTTIETSAFSSCSALKDINIPGGLVYVGDSAFSGCESLTDIVLPDKMDNIGSGAFSRCSKLTITLPSQVENFKKQRGVPFYRCAEVKVPQKLLDSINMYEDGFRSAYIGDTSEGTILTVIN